MIIAIDGPSGAGKSTVAKAIAKKLGFSCLDTGALYRSIAWLALKNNVSLNDADALGQLTKEAKIEFECEAGNPLPTKVIANGFDVTKEIRTAEIDKAVTPVSATKEVREALLDVQRSIGNAGNYVVEGRDIGTVIFPNAEVKVFLFANASERAHRRVRQNVDRGIGSIDYEEVLADLNRRDEKDSSRDTAPLVAADDAVKIDSSSLYIEEVIEKICALANEKMFAAE